MNKLNIFKSNFKTNIFHSILNYSFYAFLIKFPSMYTFPQQQKIFKDLLNNNPSNKQCADCNTIGPTWASLNFGVFLCSNCSGAHRALGPTITRVKSTKLDQWQKEWMECMQIGNKQLNEFWQAQMGMNKKPKMGASQPQLMKYATQKYVKKRFVKNQSQQDPLTRYKNGTYVRGTAKQDLKPQQIKKAVQVPTLTVNKKSDEARSNVAVQNESRNLNLLQFEFPQQPKLEVQSQSGGNDVNRISTDFPQHIYNANGQDSIKQKSENLAQISRSDEDDEFSEYTEHGTSFTGTTSDANLTFEEILAKRNQQVNNSRFINPPALHHTHSASEIPHYTSPPLNINMNGHQHHVGGHQAGYANGNTLNFKQLYTQTQNPYQSVGFIPTSNQPFNLNQQQYSMYGNQNSNFINQHSIGMGQNYGYPQAPNSPYLPHNNYTPNNNIMSNQNQTNLNPHGQTLGGYHNQGFGSHAGLGSLNQPQKQQEFKWNDFTGWQGMGRHHQNPQQNQPVTQPTQQQPQQKSWLDDWK